jgi:mRNA interferase RelE/StbE
LAWTIKYSESCLKELKKIDKFWQRKIIDYLEQIAESRDNPRDFGKPLLGNLSGLWRYRIGDYRVICQILDQELVILTTKISHRKDVYQ